MTVADLAFPEPGGFDEVLSTADGARGLGEATLRSREQAVLKGRDAREIQPLWSSLFGDLSCRGGPVLMTALSAIDQALWDLWSPNVFALHSDLFPPAAVARATGITGVGTSLGGALFTALTGYVVQYYGYAPAFAIIGLTAPVACIALLTMVGPPRSGSQDAPLAKASRRAMD